MLFSKAFTDFLEIPLYGSLIYFGEKLIYNTLFELFNIEKNYLINILPIIVTFIFISPVYISYYINENIYCIVYYISGMIHSYLLNVWLCCVPHYLITKYLFNLSFNASFFICLILPLFIIIYGGINARIPRYEKINLKYKGFKGKKTIVHISDLHLGAVYQEKFCLKIINKIKKVNPDIVVITGDLADDSLKFNKNWIKNFNDLTMPILFVCGNHDFNGGKDYILNCIKEATKIKYIHKNEIIDGINFIGFDYEDNIRECLSKLNLEKNNIPNILLYHIPELYPFELKKYNIFLHLAGHTHAGQNFPVGIPTWFLNTCFDGLYHDENNEHFVFVTDGVCTAFVPIRTLSKSEIAIITIEGC